jgi:hypothetical protein
MVYANLAGIDLVSSYHSSVVKVRSLSGLDCISPASLCQGLLENKQTDVGIPLSRLKLGFAFIGTPDRRTALMFWSLTRGCIRSVSLVVSDLPVEARSEVFCLRGVLYAFRPLCQGFRDTFYKMA